jgi:magnesium-transporting ATPase (P-type)
MHAGDFQCRLLLLLFYVFVVRACANYTFWNCVIDYVMLFNTQALITSVVFLPTQFWFINVLHLLVISASTATFISCSTVLVAMQRQ